MNNKDLLKLAALNSTLDKEQIRKNAIKKANKVVVLRRAVAAAACTILMVGVMFRVTVLNPPQTDVMIHDSFDVKTNPQNKKKTKTVPSSTHKKTYKTAPKTTPTKNKAPLIPWYDNTGSTHKTASTESADKTLASEPQTMTVKSTQYLELPPTVALSPSDKEIPTVQITKEINHIEYDDHIAIISYYGEGNMVILPSTINGKPVTTIRNTFNSKNNIKYVWIPTSVTHIDEGTFAVDSDVVIKAEKGSYAQQYAQKNNFEFSEFSISY